MTKQQTLLMAFRAMQEYSQIGMISNHRVIMNTILQSINDDSDNTVLVADPAQVALSSMLMVQAIERAKQIY